MSSHLQVLDKMLGATGRTFRDVPSEVRKLGADAALKMYWSWLLHPPYAAGRRKDSPSIGLGKLKLKGYPYPFFFRHGASDVRVIRQIFLKEQYGELQGEKNVSRIIDCGANIGCSAVYFLSKYPDAELIAIEPDEDNCRLLRKNLEPFGERARVLQAAVWSSDQRLRIDRGQFGDGKEWSYQVRVCRADEQADVSALGLETVINKFNWEQVDLLKIDVEGAERELFASGYVPWLSRTRNLAIELHDPDCERVFSTAMTGYHCQVRQSGETTICRNIGLKSQ
jgi:FkbM family methyltransferase